MVNKVFVFFLIRTNKRAAGASSAGCATYVKSVCAAARVLLMKMTSAVRSGSAGDLIRVHVQVTKLLLLLLERFAAGRKAGCIYRRTSST